MKALSLTQPWASLVVAGEKRWETRSWSTAYRGHLAIHASKGFPRSARGLCVDEPFAEALRRMGYGGLALLSPQEVLPVGAILGTVILEDVITTEAALARYVIEGTPEESFGDYSAGRYAWKFREPLRLEEPIPAKGALSLWEAPDLALLVNTDG